MSLPEPLAVISLMPEVGGVWLDLDQRLFRIIHHGPAVSALVDGRLGVTRTGMYLEYTGNDALDDVNEGGETEADGAQRAAFFGSSAPAADRRVDDRRTALPNNSYLSCWFRLTPETAVERCVNEFADGPSAIVVTTVPRWMAAWRPREGALRFWAHLAPVTYLGRTEATRAYQDQVATGLAVPLRFKDRSYAWQREARLILHPGTMEGPDPLGPLENRSPQADFAEVALDPEEFIERLLVLDDGLLEEVKAAAGYGPVADRVVRCAAEDVVGVLRGLG